MKRLPALLLALCLALLVYPRPARAQGRYRSFAVAIYVTVAQTQRLADPQTFAREFDRISSQLKFDKVYVEGYRDRSFATDAELEAVKRAFAARGVRVAGGVTLSAGGQGGQFGTFDYESPADRAECQRAVELVARHFDEVILDDFFFYTSKSDADIAAKGSRSWTRYRLDTMREAAQKLVLEPARRVHPGIKLIIKYPNWYEHFQGLGYDLDQEAHAFDAIYTGTETRDPFVTDQLLQQYESYLIVRYFDNIRPDGGNLGGWVDTYSIRYIDRYAEQLWGTLFAKTPEITLFNWGDLAGARGFAPGERTAWQDRPTSFRYDAMLGSYKAAPGGEPAPGWARAAGYALEQVDGVVGQLGKPIGIAGYKPYQSSGEDFLHDYLGNIGIPIELYPSFPKDAATILLTESAAHDPRIVSEIKDALVAGKRVFITSGLLRALQGKGIEDIVEWRATGHVVAIHDFVSGFGAGSGATLNDPAHDNPAILFPEIRFFTNDSWGIIRGVAGPKGFPLLLMNRYSKGIITVLAIPENPADLYQLPQGVTSAVKAYLMADFPVRIESPAPVSLFAYDNGTFVVESFLPTPATVRIVVAGEGARLRNLTGDDVVAATPPAAAPGGRRFGPPQTAFTVQVEPHSYQAYRIEK